MWASGFLRLMALEFLHVDHNRKLLHVCSAAFRHALRSRHASERGRMSANVSLDGSRVKFQTSVTVPEMSLLLWTHLTHSPWRHLVAHSCNISPHRLHCLQRRGLRRDVSCQYGHGRRLRRVYLRLPGQLQLLRGDVEASGADLLAGEPVQSGGRTRHPAEGGFSRRKSESLNTLWILCFLDLMWQMSQILIFQKKETNKTIVIIKTVSD